MKTAVCMSGKPREIAETWKSFVDNLLAYFPNPDVFIHTSEPYPAASDFFSTIPLKKYVIEQQYRFEALEAVLRSVNYHDMGHANSYIQQLYGMTRVWALKQAYEFEQGFTYDLAVRVRPDFIYLRPIKPEFGDLSRMNVFGPKEEMGTEFAWGSCKAMDKFFSTFAWLCGPGEWLLNANKGRNSNNYNLNNGDLIVRTYLLDYLKEDVNGMNLHPYEHYRIMSRHKQGSYG